MKKNIFLFSLFLILVVSCKEEKNITPSTTQKNMIEFTSLETYDPKPKGKIKFYLHRGKKWSKRNGYPPCTQSAGICSVKVGISFR
jgi:hypothetical protein